MIPVYKPIIAKNQKRYVVDCIDSNWISWRGKYIDLLENQLSRFLNIKHTILVNSGTSAVNLILAALDITHNDEVICPSLTYAGGVAPIHWVGANTVFVDSKEDLQLKVDDIEASITPQTRALLVPELYGDTPDLTAIKDICNRNNIIFIEDSAETFGCKVNGQLTGTFGAASAFSFFSNKIITGGELGCVCTDDDKLMERLRLLRNHGHVRNFYHEEPGFNFRPNNIAAAIALAQLEEIDWIISRKKYIAEYYRNELHPKIGRIIPTIDSSEWMPVFELPENISYEQLLTHMNNHGIDIRPCFHPVHLMNQWKYTTYVSLKNCEQIYKKYFNLPCFPDLEDKDLDYIVKTVESIII